VKYLTLIIALTLTTPAWAGNKSSTSSVTQNTSNQSWTQKCTVKKTGVSPLNSYNGLLWIRYNDPYGEQEFFRSTYVVGPGATTFTETSTGLYSISAKLTSNSPTSSTITVTFSATRYGPLTPKYNGATGALVGYGGTFTCQGSIYVGTVLYAGTLVHQIFLEDRIGMWQ